MNDSPIAVRIDDAFAQWLAGASGSLLATTYQAGKVVAVGWDGRQVTVLMRQFDKPMGLAIRPAAGGAPTRLALATRHEIVQFADAPLLAPDFFPDRRTVYDGLFLPRVSHYTGDLNIHDAAFGDDGLWFANTRFCCLARPSAEYSFIPVWKPPFLSEIVPEDRCHLNGLCMQDGKPAYVTCLGETDVVGGWRDGKATGGVVIDVRTNQVVSRGLAMPHSPRLHEGRLYVLDSGRGELVIVDPADGRRDVVFALPAYLRGLCLVGSIAFVGMCKIREKHIFGGLPVQERCKELLCGVAMIDLRHGRLLGMMEFTSGCEELFEIGWLPGVRRPQLMNLQREETRQAVPAPTFSYWLRKANEIVDTTM
ncbi:MAG: TIGR03032 family protein [Planctomycetia bacterium]